MLSSFTSVARKVTSWRFRSRPPSSKETGSTAKRHRASSQDPNTESQRKGPASKEAVGPQIPSRVSRSPTDRSSSSSGSEPERPVQRESSLVPVAARPAPSLLPLDPRQLEARQLEEKEFIRQHDTAEASVWYLVDVQWLQEWKQFVTRHGPLPGPIDNSRLVDMTTGRPRSGLKAVDDYRGVNSSIWQFWHQRYGGGPVLARKQLDLYALPLEQAEGEPKVDISLPGAAPPSSQPRPLPGLHRHPSVEGSVTSTSKLGMLSSFGGYRTSSASSTFPRDAALEVKADGQVAKLCCDKCDGPHETDRCPHFKKPREKHDDAWSSYGKSKSSSDSGGDGAPIVRSARVVAQPGDGSCLFHSLSYGLSDGSRASTLRKDICGFIAKNPDMTIADTAIKDWIRWDTNDSVQAYAARMAEGTWGGGIEMAALTRMKKVNVHVYEKCKEGYRRISAFDCPGAKKTVNVLYQGRMHYDAIAF